MTTIRRRRALKGTLVATAVAVATATIAGTASAAGTAEAPVQPTFELYGANKQTGELQVWYPIGNDIDTIGPLGDVSDISDIVVADNDNDGHGEAEWTVNKNGRLDFYSPDSGDIDSSVVGRGWNIYTTVLSPGTIGGAQQADLLGVDKSGVLWSYLSYANGTLTPRVRVGGGWNAYTQIAGQGDLSGDGKADIVARDKTGVLWFYKGTGNYKAPFAGRTKIGGGWNAYDRLVSTGDINLDGKADLLARKSNGDLFRYLGTGNAAAPFKAPTKVGHGFQKFNLF
ncbi:FG-GAP repeat domain-containing protein [Streptomyces sp. NPDC056480]|uniref:FG-GAP repeat domain-containing protein n=1 Tax=Streptomyces sp. NPDC056480 TaxID=3345833 RepID=UPI003687FAFB